MFKSCLLCFSILFLVFHLSVSSSYEFLVCFQFWFLLCALVVFYLSWLLPQHSTSLFLCQFLSFLVLISQVLALIVSFTGNPFLCQSFCVYLITRCPAPS